MRATGMTVLGVLMMSLAAQGHDDEWPQFRGPGGAGTSADNHVPVEWAAGNNIAWSAKLPGYGWSSPVVWGNKVFLTTAVTDKQKKPSGGFGDFGGGSGGFRGRPLTGQVLTGFVQESLKLTEKQKESLAGLGKPLGGPWRAEEKLAALAAWLALV